MAVHAEGAVKNLAQVAHWQAHPKLQWQDRPHTRRSPGAFGWPHFTGSIPHVQTACARHPQAASFVNRYAFTSCTGLQALIGVYELRQDVWL